MSELTPKQAYLAMYSFLEAHYRRSKADDVGALLGSLSLLPDGTPADPAIEGDWRAAVHLAVSGAVDAQLLGDTAMPTPTKIPEMLKLDYEKTLAAIDKYDGHVQEIKNWSITACGGVLAFGFNEHQWPIATVAALLAIGFLFVALICKAFLIAARSHAQRLEELIQSGNSELETDYKFGLVRAFPKLTAGTLMRAACDPIGRHVTLFYILIVVVTILADLYILFSK